MSRSHSAWLARKIRRSRQRRSRSVAATMAVAVTLLILPVFVRMPVKIDESIINKIVTSQSPLSSSSSLQECTLQGGENSTFGLVIVKGSGTYQLEKPRGFLHPNDPLVGDNKSSANDDAADLLSPTKGSFGWRQQIVCKR